MSIHLHSSGLSLLDPTTTTTLSWRQILANDGMTEDQGPLITATGEDGSVIVRASSIESESAAMSIYGLSLDDAARGVHGGVLVWDFTVMQQETVTYPLTYHL